MNQHSNTELIKKILVALTKAKSGDYSARIKIPHNESEYEEIVSQLNDLIIRLSDITKRYDQIINESKCKTDYFREFIEHSEKIFFQIDIKTGKIIDANEIFCLLLGYEKEKLLSKYLYEIDSYLSENLYIKNIRDNLKPGQSSTLKGLYNKKDGTFFPLEVKVVLLEEGTETIGICSADIKNGEINNEKSKLLTHFSVEKSHEAIFWLNSEGDMIYANEAACRSLEYSKDELLSMTIFDIDRTISRNSWPNHWQNGRRKGFYIIESSHKTKSGKVFPVEVAINHLKFGDKEYHSSFVRNITERKRIEETLHLTQYAFDHASIAIIYTGNEGQIINANIQACNSLGYSKEELSQMYVWDIDPNFKYDVWLEHRKYLRSHGTTVFETLHRRKNGSVFPVEITANFRVYKNREFSLSFIRDITEQKISEEALKESEYLLKESQKVAKLGHYTFDIVKDLWKGSEVLYKIFGIDEDYIKNLEGWLKIIHPDNSNEMKNYLTDEVLKKHSPFNKEYKIIRVSDKEVRWIHGLGELRFDSNGKATLMIGTIQDVTERKKAEEELRISESRLSEAQRIAHLGNWNWDLEKNELYWSAEVFRICKLGPEQKEISQVYYTTLIHPEDREFVTNTVNNTLKTLKPFTITYRFLLENKEIRYVRAQGEISVDEKNKPVRLFGTIQDITQSVLTEEQLKASIKEKDVLLRELYHRTKNNMQVIRAMLALQSAYIKEDDLKKIFLDTENRILAMSLVHEKLYQSQNLSSIDLKEYIEELIPMLVRSNEIKEDLIFVEYEIRSVLVLIDMAIPCGLILNELLSNALKHAFPGGKKGKITISLRLPESDIIEIYFADNGVGVPENFDFRKQQTFGIQSIITIAEHQLQGEVKFETDEGVKCKIRFNNSLYTSRI